jgi:diguanylate cyclase (GGDEF)-like protein
MTRTAKLPRAELEYQVLHDPLTGLPNRTLFNDRAQIALARLRRHGGSLAVLFLDLDRFKPVNDGLGHAAGDRLLVLVGQRLRSLLRTTDTAARFGGDEFTILCEDVDEAAARAVAERIVAAFNEPFELGPYDCFLSASVGVALAHDAHTDVAELLRRADAAMYEAKEGGRARWAVHAEPLWLPTARAAR